MVDYTVEFVNSLELTPIDLMTADTSSLLGDAGTINIARTQTGVADTPVDPSSNVITFDALIQSGNFTIQHADFNAGDPITLDINNANLVFFDNVTGVTPVDGPSAVYTVNIANGAPDANYLWLVYQGDTSNPMNVKYDGTDVLFHGGSYSSMQAALDGYFGAGVWIVEGSPQDTTFTFSTPGTSFGSSPWVIQHDYWGSAGHATTDSFVDGSPTISQKYTLTFAGVPTTGFLQVTFQGVYLMTIPYTGTDIMFNGNGPYVTIQACLDDVINPSISGYGSHGGGPWTATGTPAGGTIVFTGGTEPVGQPVWGMGSTTLNVSVNEESIDGLQTVVGVRAQHVLHIDGSFGGTFTVNSAPVPWDVSAEDLMTVWSAEVAAVHGISGIGTPVNAWIITYEAEQPQSLPTVDGDGLVGFQTSFLQDAVGSAFEVTVGEINPYTVTSVATGSGQNAIVVDNVDMIAGVDIDQPTTFVAGSAGTGGAYAHFTITTDIVPSSSFIQIMYEGIIFDIKINANNTDENGDSIQTRLNNIGLAGWTYSGSPASRSMVFTRNAQQHYGSNAWSLTDDNWAGVQISYLFTDGAAPTGTATAIQRWVSPVHQGATGGTFTLSDGVLVFGPIAYDVSLSDISASWISVTGRSLAFATGLGTQVSPWEFHFADPVAVDLPIADGSLLTKDGTVNNDFTDGTSTGGQAEIQTVELADDPNNGTWAITLDSSTLDPLDFNIAAGDLQAALRSTWSNNQIAVSGPSPYQITFGDHAPQIMITADGSNLKKSVTATITRIQAGQNITP